MNPEGNRRTDMHGVARSRCSPKKETGSQRHWGVGVNSHPARKFRHSWAAEKPARSKLVREKGTGESREGKTNEKGSAYRSRLLLQPLEGMSCYYSPDWILANNNKQKQRDQNRRKQKDIQKCVLHTRSRDEPVMRTEFNKKSCIAGKSK